MISTGSCSASAIASAVLPDAVGPISRIGGTFGAIFMVRLSCAGPIVSFRSQLRHCHPWRGLTTPLSPGPHLAELGVTFESRFACAKRSMPGRAEQLRASRIRGRRPWRDLHTQLSRSDETTSEL